MRLTLYSSVKSEDEPNLVSIQDPLLAALPTVLVCPLTRKVEATSVRVPVRWNRQDYVAVCDLVRAWNRNGLRVIGELDPRTSRRILDTFLSLVQPLD